MKKYLLILSMLFATTMLNAQTKPTDTDGDGYYNIATLDQLRFISENPEWWENNFELDDDIDASDTKNWNDGLGWNPIGNNEVRYTGKFDGHGYVIDNLFINGVGRKHVGFIGYTDNGAVIKNLGISNIFCYDSTNTTDASSAAGGLIGCNNRGAIVNCYTTGNVLSVSTYYNPRKSDAIAASAGGLVGTNYGGSIVNSYSTANASAYSSRESYASSGGLVGNDYTGVIVNSFATGSTYSSAKYKAIAGGLIGQSFITYVNNCYSTGSSSNNKTYLGTTGGLVGLDYYSKIDNSFWDTQTSNHLESAGGEGKTTAEMNQQSTYKGWNFDFIWNIDDSYPFIDINTTYSPIDSDGDGYYNISTLDHLRYISENPDWWEYNFELDNDIDASDTKNWNNGLGWLPIGQAGLPFSGIFDGNAYEIKGLYSDYPSLSWVGFFGYTYNAEIKNLGIKDNYCNGSLDVGGLVGIAINTNITCCYATGDSKSIHYSGGIVGYTQQCNITRTYSEGNSSAGTESGGLVGLSSRTNITRCYATGNSTADKYSGGFVGSTNGGGISNCYSTGSTTGKEISGGFVGSASLTLIFNCYSNGSVSGDERLGGFAGHKNENYIIKCLWDTETSGQIASVGGNGLTTAEMNKQSSYVDWNFSYIWDLNPSKNNGYPYLKDITTSTIPAPKLLTPYNFAENVSSIPVLSWKKVESALFYDVQISTAADFSNIIEENTQKNIRPPYLVNNQLEKAIDYYWRVRAVDDLDTSSWSDVYKFTTVSIAQEMIPVDTDDDGWYNISTLKQLCYISENYSMWDKDFELDNDIDASETKNWNFGYGWNPIGNKEIKFTGRFDGHGYAIANLYVNRSNEKYTGFFGYIKKGEVMNLGLENNFCADSSHFTIWYGEGSITGGLAGKVEECRIHECYTTGDSYAYSKSSSIFTGSASASSTAGGFIGFIDDSNINNCYSTGNSFASSSSDIIFDRSGATALAGGFGGRISGSINNCYSIGTSFAIAIAYVAGAQDGGFAGAGKVSYKSKGNFWDTQASEHDKSASATGLSTAEMKTKSNFTDASWDFENVWAIVPNKNDGYPHLQNSPVGISGTEIPNNKLQIYPNPATNIINIAYAGIIEIYDISGQLLITTNTRQIDVSNLINGIYQVVLRSKNQIKTEQLIILR